MHTRVFRSGTKFPQCKQHGDVPPTSASLAHPVEKGDPYMVYRTPEVTSIGSASELVQGMPGFGTDGNPVTLNSRVNFSSKLEEKEPGKRSRWAGSVFNQNF
jgi:hypothetical protein